MTPDEIWIESLAPAERAQLSLAPDERLRLLEVTPTSVLLERRGGAPPAHPVAGPPSLRVELRTLPLAVLLDALDGLIERGQFVFKIYNGISKLDPFRNTLKELEKLTGRGRKR